MAALPPPPPPREEQPIYAMVGTLCAFVCVCVCVCAFNHITGAKALVIIMRYT
jgi:hypothetical protein